MMSPILDLKSIGKTYPAPSGDAIEVLKGITLEIQSGESIAIVGPSGSGKSTLLNIVGTLDTPTTGTLVFDGQDYSGLSDTDKSVIRNRKMGFVFQQHHLLPQCTGLENVLVPTLVSRSEPFQMSESRARDLLELVGLSARLEYRPGQLSGGEQLRVAVVRAMINQPRLLLADEPTGSLDRAGAETLADLLVRLNQQQGVTLIVVTHSLQLANRMGRVFTLIDGRLVQGNG